MFGCLKNDIITFILQQINLYAAPSPLKPFQFVFVWHHINGDEGHSAGRHYANVTHCEVLLKEEKLYLKLFRSSVF